MIKYLFIVVNSVFLFFLGLFSGNDVSVTSNIPDAMQVGQEVVVELKVTKGAVGGFAKLQLELPEGIIVKESDGKGASYTFNDGMAKWVWAAMPAEQEITISLVLVASEKAVGVKTIRAKYSYVDNNVKQVVEMTPKEVTITAADPSASTVTPGADTVAKKSASPSQGNAEPTDSVQITRAITSGTYDHEILITVKINKGLTRGFARYSDDLPAGSTAKPLRADGSSFSVSDGKIKFVWVNVPEKNQLEIAYWINGNSLTSLTLNGEYSYLEDNQSKKRMVNTETVALPYVGPAAIADEEESKKENQAVTETKPLKKDNDKKRVPDENTPAPVSKEKKSRKEKREEEKTTIQKETGLEYVVQIGAFTNVKVTAEKLKKKFNITDPVKSEMGDGLYKFMVGSHEEYKQARDHREEVIAGNHIKSAFVAAYNAGKRITVQEALMITNQKWFK